MSKFLTYPFVAGSTFINFVMIQRILPLNEFNLAIQFWMVIGAATLFEYTIGIGVTKSFARKGHDDSAWQDFYDAVRLYSIYGLAVVAICILFIVKSGKILSRINLNSVETNEFKTILVIAVFAVYVSGFSSLVMRVCIGLRLSHLYEYGRLFSAIIVTAALFCIQAGNPPLLLICTLMSFSLFLPGFFAFLLILRLFPRSRSDGQRSLALHDDPQAHDEETELLKSFDISYFFVACLFLLNFTLPRFMIDLESENDTSAYLLILVAINTVFSIVSSVSPQMWVDGITQKLNHKLIANRYRLLFLITAFASPFYLVLIYFVFLLILRVNVFYEYFSQALLGLILLMFYSMHTVASNLLSKSVYQLRLLAFLFFQLFLTLVSMKMGMFSSSSDLALLCLSFIHFSSILVPTATLLFLERKE